MELLDWKMYVASALGLLGFLAGVFLAVTLPRKLIVGLILAVLTFAVAYGVLFVVDMLWGILTRRRGRRAES